MATKRIKDLTNTAASVASDAYLAIDGTSNGTEKISRDNFRQDTADAFVAAPGTYNLAPLSGGAVEVAKGGTGATTAAGARTNLSVNSIDEDAQATGTKLVGPAMYFNGTSSEVTVADDDKLTFSSSTEFGTNSSGTWSPNDNTPALTDGTGTLNQHYRVDSGAGTVTQGGSTLSVINGTATTAGQAVYYDGSVWRLKDVDDLPFSISAFVKANDFTNAPIVSKYSGLSTAEWMFYGNSTDYFGLFLIGPGSVYQIARTASTITSYEDEWVHLCATYAGSGPSAASGVSFANANQAVELYINGVLQTKGTPVTSGTYAGMANTTNIVRIGRYSSIYFDGSIRDVKIFNRELTATEVAQLARGNDLGFADEWGGAFGGVYASDFSAGADNWSGVNGTADGDIDTIGGRDDNLRFTLSGGAGQHRMSGASVSGLSLVAGKRYSIKFDYRIPSGNAACDGIRVFAGAGSAPLDVNLTGTYDTWLSHTWNVTWSGSADYFSFYPTDGGSTTVDGDGDVFYVRNIKVTQLGALADFRSENFDAETGKIYDISDNAFVGTNNGAALTGRAYPVYETGTWTPSVTFGGGSTGVTYGTQEGYYTRIGNQVTIHGSLTLTSKGTDTGQFKIGGLPYTAANTSGSLFSACIGYSANWDASVTSTPALVVSDNDTTLFGTVALSGTLLTDTAFSNTTVLRFSATYQIQ